ncbi:MAG: trifunctional serine/threonine-protein kinase/ATP-binding protein/sensor histidine kinase [Xenococcaceae cyanobacterium MO_188.B32]|nr:trifunctional serine/threonine-protein kinase/ATP-binding protein/sensor histidine kinase [Xenococcaceae cyanobacterium MO_188.B32]
MLKLSGYKIGKKIHIGSRKIIYRGYDKNEQKPVIIKILKSEYPTLQDIAYLRQEYKIANNLNCEGIVKCYSLVKSNNYWALISEDFSGQSLQQLLLSQPIKLSEFLQIALLLVTTIDELHQASIIHKDLKPSNIIINRETGQVKIADFGIASFLSSEQPLISNPNVIEGTLAYMSPEQTGRMNRSLDYRTDFYSLGITFYEILTGRLPFAVKDAMELIHSHLAKQPVPPHQLKAEIPEAVSSIVMKLLAKNAEDRYQSATGLKIDLENCLSQWRIKGKIENFPLAQKDKGNRLLLPQKLYGRKAEVAALLNAFERIKIGKVELVLVSGYSGIGKTSVINEIHKPIVKEKGYFISGKFDQFKRNIPYSALIEAFKTLIEQLLTESSQKLAIWREKLLKALGINGKIIIDVIPEIKLIIGEQPDVPQLGATEAENRFNRVFQQFIRVFCDSAHPLVLFIDDLQWADLGSLKLVQNLINEGKYLLILGAYRDNEVSSTHPLIQTIETIQQTQAVVTNVYLKPLIEEHIIQFVADTFNEVPESEQTLSLATLLFNKTQGNPFFLTQLLKTFYTEKLITYDISNDGWQWKIKDIQGIGITDYSVVELIASNISKLDQSTQQILKLAACLGNQFSLDLLAIVSEQSIQNTATQLWSALQAGLILPQSNNYKISLVLEQKSLELEQLEQNSHKVDSLDYSDVTKIKYKFLHDRVQQAAYSLIEEYDKKLTHLKIGKLLLDNTTPEEKQENIFALVNQLNLGIEFIITSTEKCELAQLNLIAGSKAKLSAAYESALEYLRTGIMLLSADSWTDNYQLTLSLYLQTIEAEYLNSNFPQSSILAKTALERVQTRLEKVKIYKLIIQSDIAQNQMQRAIDTGLKVLARLDISLSQEPPQDIVINDLANLPTMVDPEIIEAFGVLKKIGDAAYILNPDLYVVIVFTQINLSIKYGNCPLSLVTYSDYALFLCSFLEDIHSGYQFGQLALTLLSKFDTKELKSTVLDIVNGHVIHWKKPIKLTLSPLIEAFQAGLETGELFYSGYAAINYCTHLFFLGKSLELVEQKYKDFTNLMIQSNLEYHFSINQIFYQLILILTGNTNQKEKLVGDVFDEDKMLPIFQESNNLTSLFFSYLSKTILAYLFKNYVDAVQYAKLAQTYTQAVPGLLVVAEHNFYYSLALLAQYPQMDEPEQSEYLEQVNTNQEQMKHWAYYSPDNFQHKYELVEAEKARILGQNWQAGELYDLAINNAAKQGYLQEEALSNELAAEFYLSCNKTKVARAYLLDAYYNYFHWGARAKVKDLEAKYPQILELITEKAAIDSETETVSILPTNTSSQISFATLDLISLLKASQVISQEILLDRLLDKLIKILLENAGAQIGFLVLSKGDKLMIEAIASVERKYLKLQYPIPANLSQQLPLSVIEYVRRTQKDVVLDSVDSESIFSEDSYFKKCQAKSVLCMPIVKQNKFLGLVYLENKLVNNAFIPKQVEIIRLLCVQAAISLENAWLYNNLARSQAIERSAKQMRIALEKERELSELKSRFISITSHEFRTPLTTILSSTEMLKYYNNKLNDEKKELHFLRIQSSVKHMNNLLEDVLLIGKIDAGKINLNLCNFDLILFCQNLVEEIKIGIDNKKYQILFVHKSLDYQACMDKKLLRQILSNLLSNAIKYSPHGGIVQFKLNCQTDKAIFQIQDRGIGIPEQHIPQLFELFHRANNTNNIPGTGLGLSIVKRAVDIHNGDIKVESKVGIGTTFTVTIPNVVQKGGILGNKRK